MKIIHQFIFPLCVSPWHTPLSSCRASRERWSMCNIPHWPCCGAESEQSPLLLAALWKLESNVQTSNITQWNIRQTLSNFVMTSSRVGSITCRRRWAEVGALWCCWTRLGRLGELGTVVILALRRLRFPLWLRQKTVSHVSYCLYFSMAVYELWQHGRTGWYRLWWVCHLVFENLHSFIMRVWLLRKGFSFSLSAHIKYIFRCSRPVKMRGRIFPR